MIANDYAAIAAKVLKRKPISARTTGLSRDRGIAIVAQAMQQSARARRRRRVWVLGAVIVTTGAAAAMAVVAVRGSGKAESEPQKYAQCSHSPIGCAPQTKTSPNAVDVGHFDGREILPGGVMQADLGKSVQVQFDSGTRIGLGENTMLAYDEGAQVHRFSLSRGSVHLEVAKLEQGQRFLVNTADAELEVRGTVFDVAVSPPSSGCAQRTSVSVQEGIVEVRSADELRTLRRGETWRPECDTTKGQHEAAAALASNLDRSAKVTPLESHSPRKNLAATLDPSVENRRVDSDMGVSTPIQMPPKAARPSDLAKQNDLYARASAERNQGHSGEALALYRELITTFPSSALVESASVQRIRILRTTNSDAALREAKQYLARYPKGFARSEMSKLVEGP